MPVAIEMGVQSFPGEGVLVGDAHVERFCAEGVQQSSRTDSYHLNYNMKMSEILNFRINVIAKEDDSRRISIVANCNCEPIAAKTTIAKLKRTIEQEFHELYHFSMLISVIEDSEGFVLSNNSVVGDHLRHGDTVYVQSHKEKMGTNMNLPSNLPDLFLTLRYVSGSVIKRLSEVQQNLSALQVLPQIINLGFWYSNPETVTNLCKLLNKLFTTDSLDSYARQAHQMQHILLLKLLHFWFAQVKELFAAFPEILQELMAVLYKLSLNRFYIELLSTHKILKAVLELSKEQHLQPELKRMAVQIIRNVSGKGGFKNKVQSSYIPTALGESNLDLSNIDEVLEAIAEGSQQSRAEALQQLVQHPKLITQATVRFDYYWKLTGIFQIRSIKDKTSARVFSQVLKSILAQTTREKAAEIIQKDIIKRMHNFLLDSHVEAHPAVFQYYGYIAKESAAKGVFNIEQASSSQLLSSPYPQFQKTSVEALADMSDRKISPIRFLPAIKDYLRLALKTEDQYISTCLVRIISNSTLDEQCRYQIVNLKGIEVLIKFLQIGERSNNSELQRACAKGLLNLSIGSRETKAKILGHLSNILQRYYKGGFDTIASSYIENILKAPKV